MMNQYRFSRRILGAALLAVVGLAGAYFFYHRRGTRSVTPHTTAERSALLENSLRAIADGERRADRERWDPEWVAHQLQNNPEKIFSWVSNNTDWIPYHGVLRGSVGVLMDRQGNSLDRSLLLAKLLIKAGYSVRLAHATLPDSTARVWMPLLAARREARASTRQVVSDGNADIRQAASAYHLAESTNADLGENAAEFAKTMTSIDRRSRDQAQRLTRLIGIADTSDLSQRFAAAAKAFADHWWVQLQRGTDWTDLDLSGVYTAAETTLSLKSFDTSLFDQIVIRFVVERASSGALIRENAFEHSIPAFTTIGEPIKLTLWPSDLREESFQSDANAKVRFRTQMLAQKQWMVRLIVGDDVAAEYTLHATGTAVNAGSSGLGGLGNAIAGIAAANDASEMTAAWVEYEIDVPGESPRTFRRPLFDLIGDEARKRGSLGEFQPGDAEKLQRSLSLMRTIEIMPIVSSIAPQYVAHLAAEATLKNAGLLRRIVGQTLSNDPSALRSLSDSAAPGPSPLYTVALVRMPNSNESIDSYIDEPNIITRHSFPAAVRGIIRMRDAVDIVSNHVGIGFGVDNSVKARIRQGIRDTNAETALFQDNSIASVADAFEKSRNWKLVQSQGDATLAALHLSDRVKATIKDEVDSGNTIVAPVEPIDLNGHSFDGWWRIDRKTGTTLGVTADGMGGDVAERQALSNVQKAFMMGWEGFGVGFYFSFLECVGAFTPSNPQSIKNSEVTSTEPLYELFLPAKAYAVEPNANWCYKSALKDGAIAGVVTFVSVAWPMVVATLKAMGKAAWFSLGNSVAVIPSGGGAGEAIGEDAAGIKSASGSAANSEPCPPEMYEGPTEPLEENPPSPGTEEVPPDVEPPPDEPLAFDPNTPVTKPGPRNNGYGYPANTPGTPGELPRVKGPGPVYGPTPPPPRNYYEPNPQLEKADIEAAQKQFDQSLKQYREAAIRAERMKDLADNNEGKIAANKLEKTAESALSRATRNLNREKVWPQVRQALDGPNKEMNDALQEMRNNPMPSTSPSEGGEAWDNYRRAFKRLQDAQKAWDAVKDKPWWEYPVPESPAPSGDQTGSKTTTMPDRPLLPGEKTRPLGNSPTICGGGAPAPVASAAGMEGVAQAVNNK